MQLEKQPQIASSPPVLVHIVDLTFNMKILPSVRQCDTKLHGCKVPKQEAGELHPPAIYADDEELFFISKKTNRDIFVGRFAIYNVLH